MQRKRSLDSNRCISEYRYWRWSNYYEAPSSVYRPIKGMGKLHSISQTPEIKEKYCFYEFEDVSRMDK